MKIISKENVIVDDKELQLQSYKHSVGINIKHINVMQKTFTK